MKYEEVKKVQAFIDAQISKSEDKSDISGIWDKIKLQNYGIDHYAESYIRQKYSKMCGQSIYDYYRNCLYNSLINSIMDENKNFKAKKQTIKGIKKAKSKIESFYDSPLSEIIEDKNRQIENLKKAIPNMPFITSYNYNSDGSIMVEYDPEQFIIRHSQLHQPLILPKQLKKVLDQIDNIQSKIILIMGYLKYAQDHNDACTISFEEYEAELPYYDSINLYNGIERGDDCWYIHDYTEKELTALTIALRKCNLRKILSRAIILEPNNMKVDIIEKFYDIKEKIGSLDFGEDNENIIKLLLELLTQGFLYYL